MPDIDCRALERVLKPERVDREHRVVKVELAGQLRVLSRPLSLLALVDFADAQPLVLPGEKLRFHRLNDQEIVAVILKA